MDLRSPLTGLVAVLVLSLAGCGKGEPDANASATGVDAPSAARSAPPSQRAPRNHIEVTIDGQTYRADTASSFGHTFLGDPTDPRYHLEMTSALLGSNDISMLGLTILNIDDRSPSFLLDGVDAEAPALVLVELPGFKGKRWRSTAGSVAVQFEIHNPRQNPVTKAAGRFDATVRELQQGGDGFLDGGQQLTVSGRFDFDRDRR